MAQADSVNYDQAAGEYAAHRRVHSGVFCELSKRGRVRPAATILEVGCGTGNYVSALGGRFACAAHGVDPSAGMLAQARTHPEHIAWLQGWAEHLPLGSDAFHLVFSVDVIHHVTDKAAFFREARRVLRPGGQVCTATDSADMIRQREILSGYFPETVEIELARYPRLAQLEAWMAETGLVDVAVVNVEEPYQVTSAQPFRDRAYSSLHLISVDAWQVGLARLERDLTRGPICGVSRYACVWGRVPSG
jgi:ubiquinone/menaquinone biosynthesis C-methylase UbiE